MDFLCGFCGIFVGFWYFPTPLAPDEEEEEEEEDEDDEDEEEERVPDEAERELLRLEFTTRMYQSFLEGNDGDFDYR